MYQRIRLHMQVMQNMTEDDARQAMEALQVLLPPQGDLDLEMALGRSFTQGRALIDALEKSVWCHNVDISPETSEVTVETDIHNLMELGKLCGETLGIIPPFHIEPLESDDDERDYDPLNLTNDLIEEEPF